MDDNKNLISTKMRKILSSARDGTNRRRVVGGGSFGGSSGSRSKSKSKSKREIGNQIDDSQNGSFPSNPKRCDEIKQVMYRSMSGKPEIFIKKEKAVPPSTIIPN